MKTGTIADLLARGEFCASEGRLVDALLYFVQAMRIAPAATEPRLRLGSALSQLGRTRDALQVLTEAAAVAPDAIAIHEALADCLLGVGNYNAARAQADLVLQARPDDPRATLVAALADLGRDSSAEADESPSARRASLGDLLRSEPGLVEETSMMTALASVLDSFGKRPPATTIAQELARTVGASGVAAKLPSALLAILVESVAEDPAGLAALLPAAMSRDYDRPEVDALRRLALAIRPTAPAEGESLVRRYADLCVRGATGPWLLWPLRSSGDRVRVLALLPSRVDDAVASIVSALGRLPAATIDLALAVVGGESSLPPVLAVPESAPVLVLPSRPDAAAVRTLAVFDADVLVDLCGMAEHVGPALALRPGRSIVSVADIDSPPVAPLVDRVFADGNDLVEHVVTTRERLIGELPGCAADRHELARVWSDAVNAHSGADRAAAMAGYARILELQPGYCQAAFLLGACRRDEGDLPGAAEAFSLALRDHPGYVEARVAAARNALARGQADLAVTLCEEGVAIASGEPALWRELGAAHLARRDGAAAAAAFEQALAIVPTDPDTNYNLGVALQMQRKLQEAGRAYQRTLLFAPDMLSAQFNLGVLLQERGLVDHAVAAFRQVLSADPRHAAANRSLGEALLLANRLDEFCRHFAEFEAASPDSLSVATQALAACQYQGDFGRLQQYLDGLREGRFQPADESELLDCLEDLLYELHFFDVAPEMLQAQYRAYDVIARHAYGPPLELPPTRRLGRIRLGYLSADMRNHVMGKMMLAAIERHDRQRFEIHFYALSDTEDDWTARYRAAGDHFERVGHLSEREAARRIARDELDLLIDLGTHTRGAKPGILVCKPARVQITHVASAGAVGCSAIDFKLTDRFADLERNGEYLVEELLPMDGCVYPYREIPRRPADPHARLALGIGADDVIIGAFVTAMKLSRRCLALWREVLARLPRARLLFSPPVPGMKPTYRRIAAAAGIEANRILFVDSGRNESENMARYDLVDFVLDTLPYGSVNGVLEPLSAGIPVVTLVGKQHAERSAYSILSNLGATRTVAHGGREYVDIAVRLAEDPDFAASVREDILRGLSHSPLTDMGGHTRALERAYLSALEKRYPAALAEQDHD
jgi:predicted O-linked N-acetylglucosamine transferase (SPINDLY family)